MKFRVKEHKIYTSNSLRVRSLVRKGFRLQSMAYFVDGNGHRDFILSKNGL